MRLGLFVNDVDTEQPAYATTRLARVAIQAGHEVFWIGASDFALDPDDCVRARARTVTRQRYRKTETLLSDLQGKRSRTERITVDDLDVLLLRNDPSEEKGDRSWAQRAGIDFGQAAQRRGVLVLNDPEGLARALNKMYFQGFPEIVRPRTLITRDAEEVRDFADECGTVVLKPLQGSGGDSVFLVRPDDRPNLNQMIDAVFHAGYLIAQEYLPEADRGDTRMILMNGRPLEVDGKISALRRLRQGEDMRSNVKAGGRVAPAKITDKMLELAEIVRPRLVADGMFLAGLDIVGDKLMEINVFSPGGIGISGKLEGVDFFEPILDALERKVSCAREYRGCFLNRELATF